MFYDGSTDFETLSKLATDPELKELYPAFVTKFLKYKVMIDEIVAMVEQK